ncbi:sensor histidine kinase [Metabacillus halosaccharovorans]|uniref:sensor histidine kinase n=1 Tax=Metabacillus halosaccharovorans TaxID=930124 RepID=UPI001C1FED27|nr:sensor histidine kinase [Metabacillus halosaccharovorans]MBU7591202.1 sensor histidine kinase [Metabacillus halosaccharovorans]
MKQKPTILLQMIIGFSIIMIITISISSYFSYRFSSKVVVNKTSQYLLESVIQMSGKIDRMLEEYDRLSLRIALHSDTQEYLKNINEKPLDQEVRDYNVQKVITHEQAYLGNEFLVELVGNQGEGGFYHPFHIKQMDWYPFLDSAGGMFWTTNNMLYDIETEDLIHGILGVREIKDYSHPSQNIGYMLTVIPVEATEDVVGNFLANPSNKVQVIDSTGRILYSTDSSEFGQIIDGPFLGEVHDSKNNGNITQEEIDGRSVYISSYTSNYSNWTVVTYIDVEEAVMDLKGMKNSTFFIVILGIIASLLFSSFFSWSLSRPIRDLASRMSNLKRGKLKPYTGTMNNREVTVLYDSFNHMIENLEETIRILSFKQIREKQAQLIAMKAQFQPHFLYNSLNTIYYYAISEKENKLAEMVLSLSELLRYSIQPGSEFVRLKEDLKQLNHYIELQRYRYEDKLQIKMNVEEELLEFPVMKLLLQPLVENAITHGLESIKRKYWLINISITKEDNMVKFIVEDNGKGMNEEEMENALKYNEDLESETDKMMHSGIGLSNLHHRVKLLYGNQYELELSSSSLGGLKVQLVIPFLQ